MQLADQFDVLLKDTVNLSQFKLDQLEDRVSKIYEALKSDQEIGKLIRGKSPQGSWAHRTIINPLGSKEFDADFLLMMNANPDWSGSPKRYIDNVYAALHRHSIYRDMPHTRKCRCVRVVYSNSMHVDIVPSLVLPDGRQVIVNRDEDKWEVTDPGGFTKWMRAQDSVANGNLRKVIRLLKYLRDHKNSFTGTRSIILTTLVGEQVSSWKKLAHPGYYRNVPTALLHIVQDLDVWLQDRPNKPSVADPSKSGVTFDHRWDQTTYGYFRDRIHAHAAEIEAAYFETDPEISLRLWQDLFGDGFKAPVGKSASPKFAVTAVAAASTVGRSGRAG